MSKQNLYVMNADINFESIMEMQNGTIYIVWLRRPINIPLWRVMLLWWGVNKLMSVGLVSGMMRLFGRESQKNRKEIIGIFYMIT